MQYNHGMMCFIITCVSHFIRFWISVWW